MLWLLAGSTLQVATAQSTQLRINITQNDATDGGTLILNIEAKTTSVSPNTLGSATIDLDYDSSHLTFGSKTGGDVGFAQGYGVTTDNLNGDPGSGNGSGDYIRLNITGGSVGPGQGDGVDIGTSYVNLATYSFTITTAGFNAGQTNLFIRTGSLTVGYFDSASNSNDTGVITTPTVDQIDDANSTSLPVELTAFDALLNGESVVLKWETATETNNSGFEVEHALAGDAPVFAALGFVTGAGTTLELQRYQFAAENVGPGRHLFRLKQVDFDGAFAYSDVVELEVAGQFALQPAYPNPFNPATQISYDVPATMSVTLYVYDVLGRTVRTLVDGVQDAGRYDVTFDATNLASGIYYYRMEAGTFAETRQMLLVK